MRNFSVKRNEALLLLKLVKPKSTQFNGSFQLIL